MAAWIIGIDRENPEHWEYAQQHGYWDMTTSRPFLVGDTLYFWQAGASLLGSVRVTEGTREITPGTWLPWNLDDDKRAKYRHRVHFEVLHSSSAEAPTWGRLTKVTGVRGATNFGPRRVPPGGEGWLQQQVAGSDWLSVETQRLVREFDSLADRSAEESSLERDLRARVEATIVLRRGQVLFRRLLIDAYRGQCAVTGTGIEGLLEAAHISPYMGDHTNRVDNSLLLRADVHTHFDLHLLTVLPDQTIRVAPEALTDPYVSYDGGPIRAPSQAPLRPDPRKLREHNDACAWLTSPRRTLV